MRYMYMNPKTILKISMMLCILLIMPALAAAATGTATSPKDIIGDPIKTFNNLPDSTRTGILLVTGLVFLGALLCVIYGIMIATGKATVGASSTDAKMRSEGIGSLLTIAGVVLIAIMVLGFVFWWFTPGNI
jgi:hypothetical protein